MGAVVVGVVAAGPGVEKPRVRNLQYPGKIKLSDEVLLP